MNRNLKNVITLYSGGGIGSWGIHLVKGIKEVLAIDNWTKAQRVFEANFKGENHVPFVLKDIFQLSGTDILRMANLALGELFLLSITAPCQGFSIAGRKDPLDFRNALFLKAIDQIKECKPKAFLIENVEGMVILEGMAPIWSEIVARLSERLGEEYHIEARVINCLYYGSIQERKRIIFMGTLKSEGFKPAWPEPDIEGIQSRTIGSLLPEIKGIGVFKNGKLSTLRLKNDFLPTVTATQNIQVLDTDHFRLPTESEFRVIAGLSPDFDFAGLSESEINKIVGNGVPSIVMQVLVQALVDAYDNRM